ncbi:MULTISPECIES: RnfABCDGE type electron transport complex subunit D [Anaerotruncus]|uniref:Ion-translocating oxidoreductase complex subunit D n=2 Tax=Anaerotruncus TaxID=244127 RepID=A0A498CQR7_9FIRM|nr:MULTISPECIES: RnfABCDGE type electron transport complex subunit D [Anaerotruncus]MBC3937503.1 RnfABCDGE type electron transport complex subunit D [Anaerotruncus massiliensis (ex Togo et al. 2019)]RLL14868.1 RnfABCDGE type electron transport complex subunit D [Anaerotruncus massiliensis (ex Liu et al. 2021)]
MITPSPHFRDDINTRKIMLTVATALLPALVMSIFYFGIRALLLTAVCVVSCVVFEYLFAKVTKKPVTISDCSAVVTGIILAFNVPVTLPFWMAVFGSFIAIVVVKCLFGGIGCNFANPAATARIFLLVSFGNQMTHWIAPHAAIDAVATATPLKLISAGQTDQLPSLWNMLIGNRGGSLGETCALALIVGGLYLIWNGVIGWQIPVTLIGSVFVFALLFGQDPFYAVLSGGVMIGAFFMATDYSTSPVTTKGKVIFAIGIGFITMVIRVFCNYPEGMSFAILLMNILVPHIDSLTITKPFGAVFEQKKQ